MTVVRRLHTLRSPAVFKTWVYQITHDRAIDLLRRQRREAEFLAQTEHESERECDDATDALENAELVHCALDELSLAHREVLTLRFIEDLSLAEIAEVVGCNLGTAKSRLHYAKQSLQQKIEDLSNVRR